MSKNVKIGLGIVVLIIIIFALSKLLGGSAGSSSSTGPTSIGQITDPQNKAILARYLAGKDKKSLPETSIDKLDQAWQEGTIKLEDYVILQLRAVYGDNKLPAAYQGEANREKDQAYLFALIAENWDSFSKPTQEVLKPFMLPPDNPESYFSPNNSTEQTQKLWQKILGIKVAKAAGETYKRLTPMDRITVSYLASKEATLKPRAEWAAQAVRDSVPKYKSLFSLNHQSIFIYFVSPSVMADYGSASPNLPGGEEGCVVNIRDNLNEKVTKTTVAHELFHCFQFKLGLKYIKPEMKWLMEATATWSEDFIYHSYNTEHEYDDDYFGNTNDNIFSLKGNHEYSLYLLFYHFYQKTGFLPSAVIETLVLSRTSDTSQVLNTRPNFNYDFKNFAIWNWNQDIAKYYVDDPKFPDEAIPNTFSMDSRDVNKIGEDSNKMELNKGGILYTLYSFPNKDIKQIVFKPKDFVGEGNSRKGLQALYKIGDHWYQEDWSGMEEKTFCRKIDEENVELVVIVASNSDLKNKTNGVLKVKTNKKCGPGWRGTITVDWEQKNSNSLALESRTITGNYFEKGHYTLHETLEYDPVDDNLNLVNQEYSARFESGQGVHGGNKECGLLWQQSSHALAGSGFDDFSKLEDPELRMNGDNDAGGEENHKFQGRYDLSFNIFSLPGKGDYKFKGQDVGKQFNLPCSLVGIPEPSGLEQSVDQTATNRFAYEPNSVTIEVKPKDRVIVGQDKFEIHDNVFGTVRWRFQKAD
ncbi:MAG: hypothetical protein WC640_03015 [Candidatus Paceibacterota bacterium]|jgi:hypothetical protein